MAVIATVTVRPLARRRAAAPPARSICDNSQPPKISPCGLASAGIAMARSAGSACGGLSEVSEAGMENPISAAGLIVAPPRGECPSSPGLTRRSIFFAKTHLLRRWMRGSTGSPPTLSAGVAPSRAWRNRSIGETFPAVRSSGGPCMSSDILTARKGPVLEITLNRPQIGNAASDAMAVELTNLLLGAAETSEIVVLRGAGEDFCVGRETMGKRPPGAPPEALELRRRNDVVFNCYGAFRRCEIPVIGVVRGRAFGFGCAIAAVCDITLAADSAKFQVPEMAHNIMPTMVMSALVDRVPRKAMTYLVWSTAVIGPQRAREAGIVSEVVPEAELDGAVEALCKQIMRAPQPARVGCKDYARAALDMDVAGAIEFARSIHAVINSSSEMLPAGPK